MGLPKWSSPETTEEYKASLDGRRGNCRACALRASLGATSQSIGGNAMGLPGPNPGGPGLTPYSGGAPTDESTSAAPPKYHHHARVHHAARTHHVMSTHELLHAHSSKSGTDTTSQLNQAELARLQQGAPPMPPHPSRRLHHDQSGWVGRACRRLLQPSRHRGAVHQGRQGGDQVDAAVMPDLSLPMQSVSSSHPLAYNLGNFMPTLAMPKATEPWSLTSLRRS
jgi:hypothetical protein